VISFAIGSAIVELLIFIYYSIFRIIVLKKSPPSLHVKVMAIPGLIAGGLWSIGNFCSIYAVLYLGEAVGYPSVQASLIVSGLWGIFYYKEFKGVQIIYFLSSALLTLGGIGILSWQKDYTPS